MVHHRKDLADSINPFLSILRDGHKNVTIYRIQWIVHHSVTLITIQLVQMKHPILSASLYRNTIVSLFSSDLWPPTYIVRHSETISELFVFPRAALVKRNAATNDAEDTREPRRSCGQPIVPARKLATLVKQSRAKRSRINWRCKRGRLTAHCTYGSLFLFFLE